MYLASDWKQSTSDTAINFTWRAAMDMRVR